MSFMKEYDDFAGRFCLSPFTQNYTCKNEEIIEVILYRAKRIETGENRQSINSTCFRGRREIRGILNMNA